MLFVKKEITPKKRFQQVFAILGPLIFKLHWLLCGWNDCLYLSYYICFGLVSFLQTTADVLLLGCQLLCGQKYTCSHFQDYQPVYLRLIRLTISDYFFIYLFIFLSIKGMRVDNAASNVSKPGTFIFIFFLQHILINQGDLALAASCQSAVKQHTNRLPLVPVCYLKMCVRTVLKISDTNKTWQSHQQRLFCLSVSGAPTVIVYDKNRFCKISPWITWGEVNSLWFIILQVGGREPLLSSPDGRNLSS